MTKTIINNNDIRNISSENIHPALFLKGVLAKFLFYGSMAIGLGMILPEIALATSKFDIDKGVTAATDPLIKGLTAHWGKGVLLAGGASALVGEGDLRQKAIRAAIGCGVSGGVVLALIAMLG